MDSTIKIYHIYENDIFAQKLIDVFKNSLIELISINSFEKALKNFKINDFDYNLILISLEKLTSSFMNFFKEIKSLNINIQIVAILDTKNKIDLKNFMNFGFYNYISINLEIEEIKSSILNLIGDKNINDSKLTNLRTVIIDDEKLQRIITKELFILNKITNILEYCSGEQFLIEFPEADLYIVDIIMEEQSGINVVIKIRERFPKAIIIVASSLIGNEIINSAIKNGANDFILKPYNKNVFINKVKSYF